MKPMLLALAVLLASALSSFAQTNQPSANAPTPTATNTTASSQTTTSLALASGQTNQASSVDIDALLKYQEFLRKESEQSAKNLDGLIQHTKDWLSLVGWGVAGFLTLAAGILAYLGLTAKEAVQVKADGHLEKAVESVRRDMQAASQAAFDARLKLIDSAYSRRQAKYLKLLKSFYEKLFETNPELVGKMLGPSLSGRDLKGKSVLWVEDDPIGIALLEALLKDHCGLKIEIVESTERALSINTLTDFQLVISNLRRDPHDDAGIRLTEAIRKDRRSEIPVIIFTRAENATLYKDAIQKSGATAIATSHDELLSEVAKCLQPKSPTPKKP